MLKTVITRRPLRYIKCPGTWQHSLFIFTLAAQVTFVCLDFFISWFFCARVIRVISLGPVECLPGEQWRGRAMNPEVRLALEPVLDNKEHTGRTH